MPTISHDSLRKYGAAIFAAAGFPPDQGQDVTDHLVDSNLVGHDSHGVIRLPGYITSVREGNMKPVGTLKIVRESPVSLVIDAQQMQGIVLAKKAMEMAVERAQEYTFGAVAVHRSTHIGRLGAFPPIAAEQDCIGLLMLNGGGPFTAPFGGTGRRLPPNPLAFSAPRAGGGPLMLDMTTSMVAGGKVDVQRARGLPVPDDWLIDAEGNAVLDPNVFMAREAAMLPVGGSVGHKGYGLGMMIDAIAGGLSWAGCSADPPTRGASGWLALAIKIDSFIDADEYKQEVEKLVDWVRSSPKMPGVKRIYYPGEIEEERRQNRIEQGIPIEESTWSRIVESGEDVGVSAPAELM
ncbi:MAG: Ldh family oxidoreductase [Caldilineaceae bacterium]|nr:Ldh family oxidoreductase [Caldilineaceae bacterium]